MHFVHALVVKIAFLPYKSSGYLVLGFAIVLAKMQAVILSPGLFQAGLLYVAAWQQHCITDGWL